MSALLFCARRMVHLLKVIAEIANLCAYIVLLHFVHLLFKFIETCNFPAKSRSLPPNNEYANLHAKFGEFSMAICICMESLYVDACVFTSSLINVHFQASNIHSDADMLGHFDKNFIAFWSFNICMASD